MTEAVIRSAEDADVAAIVRLRGEWTQEQGGDRGDPTFDDNQGIGRRLISAVLGYADDNGFARVVLSPTERSIPFYESAGFGPANALMLRPSPHTTTDNAPRSV